MPLYLVFYNTVKRRLSIAVLITTIARRSNRLLPTLIGMLLNEKKTTLMMFNFTKNKQCIPFCSLTDGHPLPVIKESRLLGIILDEKLSWWPLVHDLLQRAKAKVWSLVKCREAGASRDQLVSIYIARVRSTLEYAAQVFDPLLNESQLIEIEAVQTIRWVRHV